MSTLAPESWTPHQTHHVVSCMDLNETIAFYCDTLGFQLDTIGPADSPAAALLSGHGHTLLLATPGAQPTPAELPTNQPEYVHTAPNNTNAHGGAEPGRAGLLYRDLLPNRQGGRFIASHISVPQGGPVEDYVHHHHIRFQLIFCHAGWVDVVYEEQGPPFRMEAGDCVVQPPHIRHRVLESSPGLEVVEIGCPAQHDTHRDHVMTLPTAQVHPDRDFGGQTFLRHRAADAPWETDGSRQVQHTHVGQATNQLANTSLVRMQTSQPIEHSGEFLFWFVRSGTAQLAGKPLATGHSVTFPPNVAHQLENPSDNFEVLQVTVHG